MSKTKIYCYRIGSRVDPNRARDCLAYDGGCQRFCGYCKHSRCDDVSELVVDFDTIFRE